MDSSLRELSLVRELVVVLMLQRVEDMRDETESVIEFESENKSEER
jgi:hypothetical protein